MKKGDFRFKEFLVTQENCGMKVSTDACLLGALLSPSASTKVALDIGTGSGVLSLMLAQNHPQLLIDAIEIDQGAYDDAIINFKENELGKNISLYLEDFNLFSKKGKQYDFIFSNPPYFQNAYKSSAANQQKAKHNITLDFDDLIDGVLRLLRDKGQFMLILPSAEFQVFEKKAFEKELFIEKKYYIYPVLDQTHNRIIATFGFEEKRSVETNDITIRNKNNIYTDTFTDLLQPYYLYL